MIAYLARRDQPVWVIRTLLLAGLIVIWELAIDIGLLGRTVLATPSQIAQAAWMSRVDTELLANIARTLGEVIGSFGLAVLLGVPLGLLLWHAPSLFRAVEPFLSALYAVPLIFCYPLLLAYFGLGPGAIIAIAATTAAIPIMLHTRVALLHVRAIYWKLARLQHATAGQRYRTIVLPAAAPYLVAGCKLGFAYAMISAVAAEFVLTDRGIGHAVRFNYELFQADRMYVYICLIIGLALLAHGLFAWAERRLTHNQITQVRTDMQVAPPGSQRMRTGRGMAALGLALIVAWHVAAGTQPIPTPIETIRLVGQSLAAGALSQHLIATLQPALYGFGLAFIAGSTIGAILGRSYYWRRVWEPVFAALNTVPKITLFPLFIVLFGLGLESRVFMAFVHAIFPILIAMLTGVKELNPVYTKLARTTQASPLHLMTKLYLPALAPAIAGATRLGLSLALLGVVLSETFAAKQGLGYLVMDAYAAYRLDQMVATIALLYAVAVAFELLPLPGRIGAWDVVRKPAEDALRDQAAAR